MATGPEQPHLPPDEAPDSAPNAAENVCPVCSGSGRRGDEECARCGGSGRVTEAVGGG